MKVVRLDGIHVTPSIVSEESMAVAAEDWTTIPQHRFLPLPPGQTLLCLVFFLTGLEDHLPTGPPCHFYVPPIPGYK